MIMREKRSEKSRREGCAWAGDHKSCENSNGGIQENRDSRSRDRGLLSAAGGE